MSWHACLSSLLKECETGPIVSERRLVSMETDGAPFANRFSDDKKQLSLDRANRPFSKMAATHLNSYKLKSLSVRIRCYIS